jgi:transposase
MTEQAPLFALPEPQEREAAPATQRAQARVVRPNRHQVRWEPRDLDAALSDNHPARAIWDLLERLDLSQFYAAIKAVLDQPGRPATDPQVLLALWIYATIDNVGSARQLARLCEEHDAYRWLRGDVPVNYHMLADFRVSHQAALDALLSQIVATLMAAGAVTLEQVAQDGLRVRASAGGSSFRQKDKLRAYLEAAEARVRELAKQRTQPDPYLSNRQRRARERAARQRQERIEQALSYLPELEAVKAKQRRLKGVAGEKVSEPRLSTTDPEARIMKMADGGFRPGYNVQLATDAAKGIIVGVQVTASGADAGQASLMAEQVRRRTGRQPGAYLVDGGYVSREDITVLEQRGVPVYAPVRPRPSVPEADMYQARPGDSPEVIAWRKRMSTEAAKAAYRKRASTAEWANAQVRAHGVCQFNVRGLAKVTTVMLLIAVAHDLMRWLSLTA